MDFYIKIVLMVMGVATLVGLFRFLNLGKRFRTQKGKIGAARQKDDAKQEGIDQFVEVEARVYDNTTRTIYNKTITGDIVRDIRVKYGNLGRKWLRDGHWVYALNKTDSGYKPVEVPKTLNDPPSELHRALQQHETGIVFNVEAGESLFGKYGPYIWIGVIGAVAIFILIAQGRGG